MRGKGGGGVGAGHRGGKQSGIASSTAIRAGRAYIEFGLDQTTLDKGLRAAQAKVRRFGAGMRAIGTDLLGLGSLMAAPLALATRTFASFDDSMRVVEAKAKLGGKSFDELRDKAKQLGRTTSFSASQVAGAMGELAAAGYNTDQIDQSIEATLNLARATNTELPRAAEVMTDLMQGFGMGADQSTRAADVMTAAVNGSAQTMEDLFESMKLVAPIARETGATIEETSAALGILANNGIKGSLGGTALKRAYLNLASESGQQKVAEYGVKVLDESGDMRPVVTIISELGEAVKDLGSGERIAAFDQIFGRGAAASLAMARAGADYKNLLADIKAAGGQAEAGAKKMDAGIGGALRRLMSALEGMQIAIGEAIAGGVRKMAEALTWLSEKIALLTEQNAWLGEAFLWLTAGVLGTGAALVAAGIAVSLFAKLMGVVALAVKLVTATLAVMQLAAVAAAAVMNAAWASTLTPVLLLVAAVAAVGTAVFIMSGQASQALGWLTERFDELWTSATEAFNAISAAMAAGDIQAAAGVLWAGLRLWWQKGINWLMELLWGFRTKAVEVGTWIGAGMAEAMVMAIAKIRELWINFWSWFKERNADVSIGSRAVWAGAVYQSKRAALNTQYAAGALTDQEYAAKQKENYAQYETSMTGLSDEDAAERVKNANERQAALNSIGTSRDEWLKYIADTEGGVLASENAKRAEALAGREGDLAAARAEYEESLRRGVYAGEKRDMLDAALGELTDKEKKQKGLDAALAELSQRAVAGAAAVPAMEDRITAGGLAQGQGGIFDVRALQSLRGTSLEERGVKAAEKTAKNTERLLEEVEDGADYY